MGLGQMLDVGQHEPLAFAPAHAVVADSLKEMRFPEKVLPSAAARQLRELSNPGAYSGKWGEGPYFVDHLDRVMDCLAAQSPYREVGVMGPSQVGKSEIGNNWQLHTVIYDPTNMLFVMPDQIGINQYVKTEFQKMLDLTKEMRERLLPGASADTINLKRFRGADLYFLWPSGPTFRARAIPRGRLDDLDDIATDIGDQGDAISLMYGRMGSLEAYGQTMLYVNSTPKLGPNGGIEAFVAGGTDERMWVDCLECHSPFEMCIDHFDYDRTGTKEDAAASACMVCPGCGSVHLQRQKRPLLETYRWVGRGERAVSWRGSNTGKSGVLEKNIRASFRLDGVAGFRPWSNIAQRAREAELALEYRQDEGPLKAFDQTIVGRNFRTRREGERPVTEDELVKRAEVSAYRLGEVPPGVVVLIASIDQQGNRFEVAVWGFGLDNRAWLIDRFAIMTVEEGGRQRQLRPATRSEDWAVLHPQVLARTYPMAGAPHLQMKIFNTIVDTGGLDNATDNAFAWWHSMVAGDPGSGRKPLPETAITLVKGGNKPDAKLLPQPQPDAKRQIRGAPQALLYVPNVHRIKDIADVRLNRRDDGPGYIQFPRDIDRNYLSEMRVEYKHEGKWVRPEHTANETWDLYVYAYVAVLRFGGNGSSLSWVPRWARPPRVRIRKAPEPVEGAVENEKAPLEAAPVQQLERPVKTVASRTKPRRGIRARRQR